jgi:tetratricopeptide (TPR) repeat protein
MIRRQSPPQLPVGTSRRDQRWLVPVLCLVLAAITFAVFGQTLRHEFVNFDDGGDVYKNPVVGRGLTLGGLVWAFSFHSSNWMPLTWLSHMVDCQFYGLHAGGHHLTNVLLHTATVILLFLVLRQMTGALWQSAFVAAVFAIHPLRVESVAWVAERKDVLSGLFFMLTIGAYVRYARRPWSWRRYALVMFLFAMGLMCKPMLVTLPVVLLLLDYWPLQRRESARRLVLEKLPFLALSAASSFATLLAQNEAMQSTESCSLPLRFGNALVTCMVYLGQMIWPARLAVYYPYSHNNLAAWNLVLAGTLLAGLSTVAWVRRRTEPWILVGWVWYLAMLAPVAGIIQVGAQAHADRYTYLPQIGIYMAMTWLAGDWSLGWKHQRAALGGLIVAVTGVLMVCAWKQTGYWQDSETLWNHTLASTTSNALAQNNLAWLLATSPKASLRNGDKAVELAQQANALTGGKNPNILDTLAAAFAEAGRFDDAMRTAQKALELARAAGQQDLVEELNGEMKRYEAGLACRQ